MIKLGSLLFFFLFFQAVLDISQRQKKQMAAEELPPAGSNGELKFQPQLQKAEYEGKHKES